MPVVVPGVSGGGYSSHKTKTKSNDWPFDSFPLAPASVLKQWLMPAKRNGRSLRQHNTGVGLGDKPTLGHERIGLHRECVRYFHYIL